MEGYEFHFFVYILPNGPLTGKKVSFLVDFLVDFGLSYHCINVIPLGLIKMKLKREITSLRHQVQELLREEIVSGRLKPGERLVEQQLCEALDVSRTSLRESLRALEAEGLVELVPHRGAVVAKVSLGEAKQIYQIRAELEALAVRNFVKHSYSEERKSLRASLEEFRSLTKSDSSGTELLEQKKQFYSILFGIEDNSVLKDLVNILNNRINLLRAVSFNRKGRLEETMNELDEIVSSIEQHDEIAAGKAAINHVQRAADNVLNILKNKESF